jgi:hypothetical protein
MCPLFGVAGEGETTVNGNWGLILEVLLMLVTAGAIYGGIRADLRNMHRHIDTLYNANRDRIEGVEKSLHQRIDDLMERK